MKLSGTFASLALLCSVVPALAQIGVPGGILCGGVGWTGPTTCPSGFVCKKYNEWYSACVQGPKPGFVGVDGAKFILDGKPFTVVGTNSYWVGLSGIGEDDMKKTFADIASSGATTVRTWGFNDVTPETINTYPIHYQSWNGKVATLNTGANGLQHFDRVIALAKAHGLKLIVALTNNWGDYGGMDVYINQILGSNPGHDLFYTNAEIKDAFKSYVRQIVRRYANETTILGWELANEPRCRGSTGVTTGKCTPATITAWANEISQFIKSNDPNHLVALGDEGFLNQPGHPIYPYQGGEGIDFDENLKIASLDFGTVHAYPEHWGQAGNETAFGNQWIIDHAASQRKANKPVILEEYGVTKDKVEVYTEWFKTVERSGLAGTLYWQAGSRFSWGSSHDDGYAVYPDQPVFEVIRGHAANLKAKAR